MFVKISVIILFSFFSINLIAQHSLLDSYKNNSNYVVKIFEDSTVEIYDKASNFSWKKNISQYPEYKSGKQANLTIRLDTIDLSRYENYYKYLGSIPGQNICGNFISVDANGNGKSEIYLYSAQPDSSWFFYQQRIYEQSIDSLYTKIYEYPGLSGAFSDIGDITGDGLIDLIDTKINCYNQINTHELLTNLNFVYRPFSNQSQLNTTTFYDINNDGVLELVYYLYSGEDSIWANSNHIARFNPQINNYELIYYHRPYPDFYTYGISIGDFDQDGKGNFGTGSLYGKFYIYEYVEGNNFKVEFQDTLPTSNAFFSTFTNDMDGNGTPEVWVGGDFAGMTKLFAYEASSPGNYEQVYQIDIIGLSALFYGKLKYVDLDYDGEKELYLQNANLCFAFKNDKNGNYYMDYVCSIFFPDSMYSLQFLDGVDAADLDGDSVPEIISQFSLTNGYPQPFEFRSYFLKRNKLTDIDVNDNFSPSEFNLFQNYPNPFNPITNIEFRIADFGFITLKVYDVLGNEITTLVDEFRNAGRYDVTFDATQLSSGIYFYRLQAGEFVQSRKMILLK